MNRLLAEGCRDLTGKRHLQLCQLTATGCRGLCEDSGLNMDNFTAHFAAAARLDGQLDTCSMSSFLQSRKARQA